MTKSKTQGRKTSARKGRTHPAGGRKHSNTREHKRAGSRGSRGRRRSGSAASGKRSHSATSGQIRGIINGLKARKRDEKWVRPSDRVRARPLAAGVNSLYERFQLSAMAHLLDRRLIYELPGVHIGGFNTVSGLDYAPGITSGGIHVVPPFTAGYEEKFYNNDGSAINNPYYNIATPMTSGRSLLRADYDITRGRIVSQVDLNLPVGASEAVFRVLVDPEAYTRVVQIAMISLDGVAEPSINLNYNHMNWTTNPFSKFSLAWGGATPYLGQHGHGQRGVPPADPSAPARADEVIEVASENGTAPIETDPVAAATLQTEMNNYWFVGGVTGRFSWINKSAYTAVAIRSKGVDTNTERFTQSAVPLQPGATGQYQDLGWKVPPVRADGVEFATSGAKWTTLHDFTGDDLADPVNYIKASSYAHNMAFPMFEITVSTTQPGTGVGAPTASFAFSVELEAWYGCATNTPTAAGSQAFRTAAFPLPDWFGAALLTSRLLCGNSVRMMSAPAGVACARAAFPQVAAQVVPDTPAMQAVTTSAGNGAGESVAGDVMKSVAVAAMPFLAKHGGNMIGRLWDSISPLESLAKTVGGKGADAFMTNIGGEFGEIAEAALPFLI